MQTRKFSAPTLAVSVLALALGACGKKDKPGTGFFNRPEKKRSNP